MFFFFPGTKFCILEREYTLKVLLAVVMGIKLNNWLGMSSLTQDGVTWSLIKEQANVSSATKLKLILKKKIKKKFLPSFVSVKDLKQCLQDAGETELQISLSTSYAEQTAMTRCEAQPGWSLTVEADSKTALQTSPGESPSSSFSSAASSQDMQMELDCVNPVSADTTVVLEDTKHAEETRGHDQPAQSCSASGDTTLEVGCSENTVVPSVATTFATQDAPSVTATVAEPQPAENSVQVESVLMLLKSAVAERRTSLASEAEHQKNEVSLKLYLCAPTSLHEWF